MWLPRKCPGLKVAILVTASALASACASNDGNDGEVGTPGAPSLDGGGVDATTARDAGVTGLPGTSPDGSGAGPSVDSGAGTADDSGGGPIGKDAGGPATPDSGPVTNPDSGPPSSAPLRFVVFGDSRDNSDVHKAVLDAMSKMSPELILDTGDLWAGYTNTSKLWATLTTSNANIAALLSSNRYLVSRGNHETVSELLAFTPTLVRNNRETYSFTVGNAFFVSLGMNPATATAFLSQELASAPGKAATWRFVYSHYPVYDSGDGHGPVKGIPAVESICDQYHVTAFFSGHEHIYERFNQIAAGKVVDTTDALKASKGTVYVVSGGGGAPFYTVTTALPQEHVNKTDVNHYVLVDLTATTMSVQTLDTTNAVIDRFQITQ
jgi:hypothetical protein